MAPDESVGVTRGALIPLSCSVAKGAAHRLYTVQVQRVLLWESCSQACRSRAGCPRTRGSENAPGRPGP